MKHSITLNKWKVTSNGTLVWFYWFSEKTNEYQFVSSYYVETILEHGPHALSLDTRVEQWTIQDHLMIPIIAWLKVFK